MPAKLRSRLNYSNVMATIAVFLALGGTSYAVATGSIGSREIGNNSVRSKDLRNNDVRGRDVRNGTIGTRDVTDGALLATDFQSGQLPAGERGLQGERGLPGQDATKLFAYIGQVPAEFPTLRYGSGVKGVTFAPVSPFPYAVQFDRSITNCAVLATAGRDLASSGDASQPATPEVWISNTAAFVNWENDAGVQGIRTSFLIAAFC
jgi:hypothetical protein